MFYETHFGVLSRFERQEEREGLGRKFSTESLLERQQEVRPCRINRFLGLDLIDFLA